MSRRGRVLTRPWRRLRRWAQHTPNDEVAFSVLGLGCLLIIVAGFILAADKGWL